MDKRKLIILIISAIVLILCIIAIVIVFNNMSESEPITKVIVGTVSYIKLRENDVDYPDSHEYLIYLTPLGEEENGLWVPFTVSKKTELESEYSTDIRKMPELALGTKVRIVYETDEIEKGYQTILLGYQAVSLKIANETDEEKSEIPFWIKEDYVYTDAGPFWGEDKSNVINVAKMDGGYLIYLDKSRYVRYTALTVYWVDYGTLMDDEDRAMLESRQTNFTITAHITDVFPLDNFSVRTVVSLIAEQE